jgi:hypothetical protein
MIVSEKFPDIFLRYENDTIVYRIRVMEYPLKDKKYGTKWILSFARLRTESNGEHSWETLYEPGTEDDWGDRRWGDSYFDVPFFDLPLFRFRKKFFARTMIEEYEIIKAHADRDYERIMQERREETERDQSQREAFNNLVSEIEGELKE